MNNLTRLQVLAVAAVFILAAVIFKNSDKSVEVATIGTVAINDQLNNAGPPLKTVVAPINNANQRVTKKPFGIYITEANSPVQPEKFSGYHTGTDFETFSEESDAEIGFNAICSGKILQKRTATGYGGVIVQSCVINNAAVTVVYGHVSIKSISKNAGDSLTQGEKIGNLGQFPSETDGERKHLHLGIHKGSAVNILGYTQTESDLANWLNFQSL